MDRRVLKLIYNSLRDFPDQWEFGTHTAKWERYDIEVWIYNSRNGMHVNVGSTKFGGMNPLYWLMPWEWWRFRLLHVIRKTSVEKVLAKFRQDAINTATKALS